MKRNNRPKKEPWRIIVGMIAIAYIAYIWIKNDIAAIYTLMSYEQSVPLIATTVAVSFIKVIVIAGAIELIKRVFGKIKSK